MTDKQYLQLLGEKILALRMSNGWTQVELATKINTQHTQVRRIEKGQVNSTINMLRRIAKVFNLPVEKLVSI